MSATQHTGVYRRPWTNPLHLDVPLVRHMVREHVDTWAQSADIGALWLPPLGGPYVSPREQACDHDKQTRYNKFTGTPANFCMECGQRVGTREETRKHSAKIGRLFRILRTHGVIKKIPRTHRYLLTEKGTKLISALKTINESKICDLMNLAA